MVKGEFRVGSRWLDGLELRRAGLESPAWREAEREPAQSVGGNEDGVDRS